MGIQAGNRHPRLFNADIPAGLVRNLDHIQHTVFFDTITRFPQGNMGGNVNDPQIMMHQHHGIFFRVRVGGVDLGMAVKMGIAIGSFSVIKFQRLIQGFLIQGICAGGVHLTGHCQLDNLFYTLECGIAALHTHLCQLELVDIFDQVQMQHINGAGGEQRIADFLAAVDHDIFPANKLFGLFKHFDVTHNDGAAVRVLFGICQRLDGDFRAGARGIAHGNANDGFCHKSAPLNPCLWRQHLPAPS